MVDPQLPIVDDQRKLRWESERQFTALVEPGLKFRTEHEDDLGIDGTLEVIDGSHATNFRACIQLKSTRSPKRRRDATVSLSVPTSNVHYLLAHQPAAYILYLGDTQQFLARWVDDLIVDLNRREPRWDRQKHVSFPLSEELDSSHLAELTRQLVRRARLTQEVHTQVAQAVVSMPGTKVIVDPIDFGVLSEADVVSHLEADGLQLCSQGHGSSILARAETLTAQTRRRPKVELVLAFAYSKAGRHFDVIALTATPPDPSLTPDERLLRDLTRLTAERLLGRLSHPSYLEGVSRLASESPESVLGAQMRLENLKGRAAKASGSELDAIAAEMDGPLARIRTDRSAPVALHLRAMATALEVEGYRIAQKWSDALGQGELARGLGLLDLVFRGSVEAEHADAAFGDWVRRVDELANADLAKAEPAFAAHLVWLKVWLAFGHLQTLSLRGDVGHVAPAWRDWLVHCPSELEVASKTFEQAGMLDDGVFCRVLMGEILHFLGDAPAAAKLAAETLPLARTVGRPEFAERLALLEQGTSQLAEYARTLMPQPDDSGTAGSLAKADDNEIDRLARGMVQRAGLPSEFLARVRAEYTLEREVARDRFRHCRYADLESGSTVPPTSASRFAVDPLRFGVCRLHHHRSAIPLTDAEAARSAFKAAFCASCGDRAPLDLFDGPA